MPTWSELETHFRKLAQALRFHRLDYQWGAAGIYYRLAGGPSNESTRRFETLAGIAGAKLAELPTETLHEAVLSRSVPEERWYEALKYESGSFETGFVGWQTNEAGNHQGTIHTGTIDNFAEASANLALRFSALPANPTDNAAQVGFIERIVSWLAEEKKKRGLLWAVIGFIVMVVLAFLAI